MPMRACPISGGFAMTDLQMRPAGVADQRDTRRWQLAVLSAAAGVILAVIWSPRLVDGVIAGSIADPVVGGKASEVAISGSVAAAVFAFITGVGGMFTACNIAVFGAVAPMTAQTGLRSRVAGTLPPLSNARIGDPETGLRIRSIQSGLVFSLIGAVMIWYGLAAVRLVRNPLDGVFARHPHAEMAFIGAL